MANDDAWDGSFGTWIQCPHCSAVDQETSDYPRGLKHDGDKVHTTCWQCGKDMVVTLSVEYSFATAPLQP